MSYILDALNSSDQNRKKGSVPNLQSQNNKLVPPAPQPATSRRMSPLLWLAPLLFAVIVGWWLTDSALLRSSESSPTTTSTSLPPPAARPSTSASPTPTSTSASTVPDPRVDDRVAVADSIVSEPPVRRPLREPAVNIDDLKDVKLVVTSAYQDEETEARPPTTSTAETPPAPAVERVVAAERAPLDEPPQASRGSAGKPAASEPVEDPYAGIPNQRQLAADMQAALPELDISVHLHSPSPSSRLVRINGRTYREGDLVAPDLRLEAITRDGLIMLFRNTRFWRNVP